MSGKVEKGNDELREALKAWREKNGFTLKQVGKKLDINEGYVSKYLNGVPEGDVETFEARVSDMLAREGRKRTWDEIYFETAAIKACYNAFHTIRRSSNIGLVYGPAGIGKSVAVRRYAADHSTVISFTGEEGQGGTHAVQKGVASKIDTRRWNRREKNLSGFLHEKLAGSDRLIIIDNAQRIDISGLRWLMDFWDATGVSVALVGNPEVMDKLQGKDQLCSRIGVRCNIADALADAWMDRSADDMVAAMWPGAAADIGLLAREAARRSGHLRTLNFQLRIAMVLCETDVFRGKHARAFVEARHLVGADIDAE
jgi:DNA transposition AAA+ family ATPase